MKSFIKVFSAIAAVVLGCTAMSSCSKEESFDGLYLKAEEILGKTLETWNADESAADQRPYYAIVLTISDDAVARMMKYEKENTELTPFTLMLKKGNLEISWLPNGDDYTYYDRCLMISRTGSAVIGCYDEAVLGSIYALL